MNEDIINLPDYDRKKKKGKFINVIGILTVVAYISFLVSACNFKPDSSGQGISITTESRDENGFTESEIFQFFQKNVTNLDYFNYSIRNGKYSFSFGLSSDKSVEVENYDDFALSAKTACVKFSREKSVEAGIESLTFFSDNEAYIIWLSIDGGESGTLFENLGVYEHKRELTFNQLVAFYGKY